MCSRSKCYLSRLDAEARKAQQLVVAGCIFDSGCLSDSRAHTKPPSGQPTQLAEISPQLQPSCPANFNALSFPHCPTWRRWGKWRPEAPTASQLLPSPAKLNQAPTLGRGKPNTARNIEAWALKWMDLFHFWEIALFIATKMTSKATGHIQGTARGTRKEVWHSKYREQDDEKRKIVFCLKLSNSVHSINHTHYLLQTESPF